MDLFKYIATNGVKTFLLFNGNAHRKTSQTSCNGRRPCKNPKNVMARIGTQVEHLVEICGGFHDEEKLNISIGIPLLKIPVIP